MTDIDHGPAVTDRCAGHKNPEFDYPARFEGRVPKTIKMTKGAQTDVLFGLANGKDLKCSKDEEYPAWTNRHGAVSAILPDGDKLGLYPSEFEVVDWIYPEA